MAKQTIQEDKKTGINPMYAAVTAAVVGAGLAVAGAVALMDKDDRDKAKNRLSDAKDQVEEKIDGMQNKTDDKKVEVKKKLEDSKESVKKNLKEVN